MNVNLTKARLTIERKRFIKGAFIFHYKIRENWMIIDQNVNLENSPFCKVPAKTVIIGNLNASCNEFMEYPIDCHIKGWADFSRCRLEKKPIPSTFNVDGVLYNKD